MNTATIAEQPTAQPSPAVTSQRHSVSSVAFESLVLSLGAVQAVAFATIYHHGPVWLSLILALVASHLMHGLLIGFHEASHSLLRRSRKLNEFDGVLLGTFSFT